MGAVEISQRHYDAKNKDVAEAKEVYADSASTNSDSGREVGTFGSDLETQRRDMYSTVVERPVDEYMGRFSKDYDALGQTFDRDRGVVDNFDPKSERKKLYGSNRMSMFGDY